jgi:hypothetical protein
MLIDDILILPSGERERLHPFFWQDLDWAQVYEITDVARFGLAHVAHADRLVFARDLPNVAPLGPMVWMEFNLADLPDAPYLGTDIRSYGIALRSFDRRDPEDDDAVVRMLRQFGHDPDDAIRFVTLLSAVWRFSDDGEIDSLPHLLGFAIRPDGSVEGQYNTLHGTVSENMRRIIVYTTFFAALAVTFAHCHNVQTTEHQPTRQQRRFRERHGGPPLVSWRTLDIPGVERLLREQGGLDQHGLKHALHLVRANFATYTEEAPLFGKYTGMFYRPQHVRGKDKGRVSVHDYRAHPPQKQE